MAQISSYNIINKALINDTWIIQVEINLDDNRTINRKYRVPYIGIPMVQQLDGLGNPVYIEARDEEGNIIGMMPVMVLDSQHTEFFDANLLNTYIQNDAIEYINKKDAEEAIENNFEGDNYKSANLINILREYVSKAMNIDDAVSALEIYDKFMPRLIALNLTVAQYASLLNITQSAVLRINQRWNYLTINRSTIEAYKIVDAGDNF